MQSSADRITVLITNQFLANRTGTEMYAYDLALALRQRGYRPVLFSPLLGKLAEDMRGQGIEVVGEPGEIADAPDIIHGQHSVPTLIAMMRFPMVPAIYVGHDSSWHLDTPPKLDRIKRHVVVDHNVLHRFVKKEGIGREKIQVIGNGVNVEKFLRLEPLSARPRKALLFSNYLREKHATIVQRVCEGVGVSLDTVGKHLGGTCEAPEQLLGRYDIVFAKGRCAREAVAAGAAVIPAGEAGIGAMVTTAILPGMRKYNFGRRVLAHEWTEENVLKMFNRYDANDARAVSDHVRQSDTLDNTVDRLCEVYKDVLGSHSQNDACDLAEEFARMAQALTDCVKDTATETLRPRITPPRTARQFDPSNQRVELKRQTPSFFQRLLKQITSPF